MRRWENAPCAKFFPARVRTVAGDASSAAIAQKHETCAWPTDRTSLALRSKLRRARYLRRCNIPPATCMCNLITLSRDCELAECEIMGESWRFCWPLFALFPCKSECMARGRCAVFFFLLPTLNERNKIWAGNCTSGGGDKSNGACEKAN